MKIQHKITYCVSGVGLFISISTNAGYLARLIPALQPVFLTLLAIACLIGVIAVMATEDRKTINLGAGVFCLSLIGVVLSWAI